MLATIGFPIFFTIWASAPTVIYNFIHILTYISKSVYCGLELILEPRNGINNKVC